MKKFNIFILWLSILMFVFALYSFAEPFDNEETYFFYFYTNTTKYTWLESAYPFILIPDGDNYSVMTTGYVGYKFKKWSSPDGVTFGNFDDTVLSTGFNVGFGAYAISSNHDIYIDGTDEIYIGNTEPLADVYIALPRDGFKDNSAYFSVSGFTNIYNVADIENIEIKAYINEEVPAVYDIVKNSGEIQDDVYVNDFQFVFLVPEGQAEIKIQYKYEDEIIGEAVVNVERLVGFVDADGDGKDDRTGRTYVPDKPVQIDIQVPEKPVDGTALDWLIYIGDLISYIFNIITESIGNFAKNLVSGITSIMTMVEPMFAFVQQFFSSFPTPISAGIISLFSIAVAVGIWKLIRG